MMELIFESNNDYGWTGKATIFEMEETFKNIFNHK